MSDTDPPSGVLLVQATQTTSQYSPTPTPAERATSPPQTLESPAVATNAPDAERMEEDRTPPGSPSATQTAAATGFTPMRRGKVHALDDSPGNRQTEAARWARAQAEMEKRGKAVEEMRAARARAPSPPKTVAGGDAVRASGIPVWTGSAPRALGQRGAR